MEFRILGPLEVRDEGQVVELAAGKPRALLAILLLNANRVVSSDVLIESLWGERPPNTAEQGVYTYVAGLRRALEPKGGHRGSHSVLLSRAGGYVLARGPVEVDVEDFERRLAEARRLDGDGDPRDRLRALDAAVGSWSGPALCGVPGPDEAKRISHLCPTLRPYESGTLMNMPPSLRSSTVQGCGSLSPRS